jgi:ferredoxin/flavodoxin
MNAEVYYFSGTGNSLAVARDVVGRIGGSLISIPSTANMECINSNADTIGIVFPVYHATFGESGIPNVVRRFIEKLGDIGSKYIFAICTHSGMPAFTIRNLSDMISRRGGELSAGFTVRMGVPYPGIAKLKHALLKKELTVDIEKDGKERKELYELWEIKLNVIEDHVVNRRKARLEAPGKATRIILAPFFALQKRAAMSRYRGLSNSRNGSFQKLTMLADRSFNVDEKCNGCGACRRVCPVRNIEIVDKKPVWQNRCENCFACFQWCPQEAINGAIVEYEKRYHHPDARISDFISEQEVLLPQRVAEDIGQARSKG